MLGRDKSTRYHGEGSVPTSLCSLVVAVPILPRIPQNHLS
ncbi:hypothetical protein HMPREF9134_01103 [Porphyromonas catoniae F0037]|uniref:Uncharacterized protein n=1 Tax=Porphyromonas catoniae F0037 TaxID=1127696 RepID=L1ND36_9PORP|nr:hypothetical protein HMPREF9134_01103 [Porphyromonas catoniae F0037]